MTSGPRQHDLAGDDDSIAGALRRPLLEDRERACVAERDVEVAAAVASVTARERDPAAPATGPSAPSRLARVLGHNQGIPVASQDDQHGRNSES